MSEPTGARSEETRRAPYRLAVINSHPIQYFVGLYRRLARMPEVDLTVFYCSRAGLDPYDDPGFGERVGWDVPLLDGYTHRFLRNLRRNERPSGFWSLLNPGVVRAIRQGRYDAVLIHGHSYATNLLAAAAAKLHGTALFMRCETHLGLKRSHLKRALRRPLMSMLYRMCDACLAVGSRNRGFYRAHGVPERKVTLVPYVVDNTRFHDSTNGSREYREEIRRRQAFPDPSVPVILYLSKLIPRKHPMDLLRAFHTLSVEEVGPAALVFVGSGEEEKRLRAYVGKHRLGGVHFLGFRNQSELPGLYAASDIFVLPSENEPWGVVVNEAMCAGLPIVTTEDVGAAADLVEDGKNGFVIPPHDVPALADRLGMLVRDAALRQSMGRASRTRIATWSVTEAARGIVEALDRCVAVEGRRA